MQYISDITDDTISVSPYSHFTTHQAIELANQLPEFGHITRVNLNNHDIEDEGAIALAKVKQIKYLDLTANLIGNKGAQALARNNTIKELYR